MLEHQKNDSIRSTEKRTREAVDGYLDAWQRNDREALLALYAEDAVWIDPVGTPPMVGRTAIGEFWDKSHAGGNSLTPVRVQFSDRAEHLVLVEFDDVCGVRWQESGSTGPEERNDSVYELVDSDWLAATLADHAREREEGHRHFKLGFNAYGPLEVLATEMRLVSMKAH